MQTRCHRHFAFVLAALLWACSGWASADPPSRIGRLGYVSGVVSFSPAGESDWNQATINRPISTGDRIWADSKGRAEIQISGALVRMNADTGLSVINLDDQIAQLELTQGRLNIRVHRLERGQVFEVDTPNLALIIRQPGDFRIDVDPDRNTTTVVVRQGQAEAYGDAASYVVDSRQPYRFTGTDLYEVESFGAPGRDAFDRWSNDRDRAYDRSPSARYVSPGVIGYQDLDANGVWRVDATYGNVWIPNRVAAGWTPYRDGHWAWVDPWGWTWIDDAPWGFAVSHYGRWANLRGTWGWVPGPVSTRAYYAPALVAFVGGDNFRLTVASGMVGAVAWFALAPHDVYRPSYPVSRGYFENVNRSNAVISNTVINNYYDNSNVTQIVYMNRRVPGAVVAVPTTAFIQAQPVSRAALMVAPNMVATRPAVTAPPVAPIERSVRGAAPEGGMPPPRVFERPVLARAAPPAAHVGFATQQPHLTVTPGHPLDDITRKDLKPLAGAPAPAVKVIVQPPNTPMNTPPTARPPPGAGRADPGATQAQPPPREPTAMPATPPEAAAPGRGAPPPTRPAVLAAPAVPQHQVPDPQRSAEPRPPATTSPQIPRPQRSAPQPATPAARQVDHGQPQGRADRPVPSVAPPQHATESEVTRPPAVAPVPAAAPATQRPARPGPGRPGEAGSNAPATPRAADREPRPAAAPEAPRSRESAPSRPPPQPRSTSAAQLRGQSPKPAASEPEDEKKNKEDRKRDGASRGKPN